MPGALLSQIKALLLELPAIIPGHGALLEAIFATIGDPEHPWNWHHGDARRELLRIAALIDRLSPAAEAGLRSGPMQDPRRVRAVFLEAADEIEALRNEHTALDRDGKCRGRGPDLAARAIADAAASAYANITERNPPVVDFYGTGSDHAFHQLVAGLFALAGLGASSEYHARKAAERLADRVAKIGSK